jgi:cysteine desulfurase
MAMSIPDRPVYLDHNASTPVLPEVVEAMIPFLRDQYGNPSSTHAYGASLRGPLERARAQVAALIECAPAEVFFTSGGTEANNLAIRGVAAARPDRPRVVTSVIEHPATAAPCDDLERIGWQVTRLPVDGVGRVDVGELDRALQDGPAPGLVTVMYANSETGTLQPIREIAKAAHQVGATMHTDAAQACGKVPVSVADDDVDLLSLAGHKLYAPKGVGALFVRSGTPIRPFLLGAGHERGLRPGTENVAFIVGLGTACQAARRDLELEGRRVAALRDRLWGQLASEIPGLAQNGDPNGRLPNTLSVRFPGTSGDAVLAACPEVAASTGSACHAGVDRASDVILAMGFPEEEALGSVRLSLGRGTTEEQLGRAAAALVRAWRAVTSPSYEPE